MNRELETIVEAFETACSRDSSVDLRKYVPPANHPNYKDIVIELVRIDLELSWNRNAPKYAIEYKSLFPDAFEDERCLEQVAFEEYRLRSQAGHSVSPFDYQEQLGINTRHWPLNHVQDSATSKGRDNSNSSVDEQLTGSSSEDHVISRPAFEGQANGTGGVFLQRTLHRRLRFVSIAFTIFLGYFAGLVVLNPVVKVGLFLGSNLLIGINTCALLACGAITVVLWARRTITTFWLRRCELILFGLVLLELGAGLFSDLFVDHELVKPLSEGDHSLFHYASSWSLPFFALIVGYGTLIPSTWRRCTAIVVTMASVPLIICLAAALIEHELTKGFIQSFLLQMVIWMVISTGIATFGVHRIANLERQIERKQRIGKYQLVTQLAKGGMGYVFLAEHPMMQRPCAIKMMQPDCAGDPKLFARFEREVEVLARLSHPNVVQIFDYGHTENGTFYYVMEFLDGVGLDRLVQESEPLQGRRVVAILLQVCSALKTLHANGLIHRDIKPSNMIICAQNDVESARLLDFGLVKVTSESDSAGLTQHGEIIGTPAFMSPEQATGESIDVRTDIYSLGAVAYFMFCATPPFVRRTVVETLNAHICESHLPVQYHRDDIDPGLSDIVHRCLSKDRKSRFESISDIEAALGEFA